MTTAHCHEVATGPVSDPLQLRAPRAGVTTLAARRAAIRPHSLMSDPFDVASSVPTRRLEQLDGNPGTLRSIKLINYKGFENHTISLRRCNVLVGANNAGKSTASGRARLIAAMLPQARRTNPTTVGFVEGRPYRGWPITAAAIESSAFSTEKSARFRPQETRIEVTTTKGVRLVASPGSPRKVPERKTHRCAGSTLCFPRLDRIEGPRDVARSLVPAIAVVPTLTPLDDRELFITDETLRRNRTSKRSSRYFRNALWRLDHEDWRDFTPFVYERTPELTGLEFTLSAGHGRGRLRPLLSEEQTRHEREIGWAG